MTGLDHVRILPGALANALDHSWIRRFTDPVPRTWIGAKPPVSNPSSPQGRQGHNPPLGERLADDPEPPKAPLSAVQANAHRLKTREGKACYAQRKSTVETVFGVMKQALGFRQLLLRGLQAVQGEWALVCIGYNLKRLFALQA